VWFMRRKTVISLGIIAIAIALLAAYELSKRNSSNSAQQEPRSICHFSIIWPGKPTETNFEAGLDPNAATEQGVILYTGEFVERLPNGVVSYTASVTQYPKDSHTPIAAKEILEAAAAGTRNTESNRREFQFGPNKFPALEIEKTFGRAFHRQLFVYARHRLFSFGAASLHEDLLRGSSVRLFFESVSIEDDDA